MPVVPLDDALHEHAQRLVDELADGLAALGLPVFLYADSGGGADPTSSGAAASRRSPSAWQPAPCSPMPAPPARTRAPARSCSECAAPLLAFNVNLDTSRLEIAEAIARAVRERDGGLPGVRALGLPLARAASSRSR